MQTGDLIELNIAYSVAILRLNHPERLNLVSMAMQQQLRACFAELRHHSNIAVLVITGAGVARDIAIERLVKLAASHHNSVALLYVGDKFRNVELPPIKNQLNRAFRCSSHP
jgi:hypothetical protein